MVVESFKLMYHLQLLFKFVKINFVYQFINQIIHHFRIEFYYRKVHLQVLINFNFDTDQKFITRINCFQVCFIQVRYLSIQKVHLQAKMELIQGIGLQCLPIYHHQINLTTIQKFIHLVKHQISLLIVVIEELIVNQKYFTESMVLDFKINWSDFRMVELNCSF